MCFNSLGISRFVREAGFLIVLISSFAFYGYPVNRREKLPADGAWEFSRYVFSRIYKERRIKMNLLKKLALVGVFSSFAMGVYAGDLGDAANAAASLTSVQGNVAVGVNAGSGDAEIKANASGKDSVANAGLAVVDAKASGGKSLNAAVGVNTAKANISATARDGGTSNAGLAVVRAQ